MNISSIERQKLVYTKGLTDLARKLDIPPPVLDVLSFDEHGHVDLRLDHERRAIVVGERFLEQPRVSVMYALVRGLLSLDFEANGKDSPPSDPKVISYAMLGLNPYPGKVVDVEVEIAAADAYERDLIIRDFAYAKPDRRGLLDKGASVAVTGETDVVSFVPRSERPADGPAFVRMWFEPPMEGSVVSYAQTKGDNFVVRRESIPHGLILM